jgi:hypothetical protein
LSGFSMTSAESEARVGPDVDRPVTLSPPSVQ